MALSPRGCGVFRNLDRWVPMENKYEIDRALLRDIFRRSGMAVALSVPVALLIALLHEKDSAIASIVAWSGWMLAVQIFRLVLARIYLSNETSQRSTRFWVSLQVFCAVAAGTGWGSCLFILDTGRNDFLFLFKFLALAAILGTALNSLCAYFKVYASFVLSTALMICAYLLIRSDFLETAYRLSLIVGTGVYTIYLLLVGWHVRKLTWRYFQHRSEREEVLSELNAAHETEKTLRKQLEDESEKLVQMNLKLQDLASLDGLTGVANRRSLSERIDYEIRAACRHHSDFSIILLDIDYFKRINDTYGHQIGDQVLIGLARSFKNQLRDIDTFGRWGGEEFLCLLPQIDLEGAMICAERLCKALENERLVASLPDFVVTASFGVAVYQSQDTANSLLDRGDVMLYAAKDSGRNCVRGRTA